MRSKKLKLKLFQTHSLTKGRENLQIARFLIFSLSGSEHPLRSGQFLNFCRDKSGPQLLSRQKIKKPMTLLLLRIIYYCMESFFTLVSVVTGKKHNTCTCNIYHTNSVLSHSFKLYIFV